MGRMVWCLIALLPLSLCAPLAANAQDGGACVRPAAGGTVKPPPDQRSHNGILDVALSYKSSVDKVGRTLFCFVTPHGSESPTLRVKPGDTINISLTNAVGAPAGGPSEVESSSSKRCGAGAMTLSSVNMHFHGVNTSPRCHSDEVIHTLINSGQTFAYAIHIPKDEPPGLYWYHPHVHGISSSVVQGGATGAIVVEGLENIQPAVSGLPERLLVLRDQQLGVPPGHRSNQQPVPNWDISVNYIPVSYPAYAPAVIRMNRGTRELWRVVNAGANTILDLQLRYDGKAQPLQIVALDGVPTGSQDGTQTGSIVTRRDILLPPAARAEFIVTGPATAVTSAMFVTRAIAGGPASDSNPARPLAVVESASAPVVLPRMPERSGPPNPQRFKGLLQATVTAKRVLYFSETSGDTAHDAHRAPDEVGHFFITVKGQTPETFDPNVPPAIVTYRGAVEDWTIQNRSTEVHEFHMHQIHFLLLEVDGVPVPPKDQQFYDTYQVGYWSGKGRPYPSIKVRMDFRGAVTGDFVYHCHILDHEDAGMMAIIRVKARPH
jgi:FtsP/CotA-like multicopper oxidase with cupredoxin domain